LEDCERRALFVLSSIDQFSSDVSRPDRLSSAEISSVVQAAGLQGISRKLSSLMQRLIKTYSCSQKSLCHSAC
jgi:hypothetical protein